MKDRNTKMNKATSADFENAKQFIAAHRNFALATHARTDGDDCGSMLAVTSALRSLSKNATPIAKGGVPQTLKFLPLQEDVLEEYPGSIAPPFDALILFGCAYPERTELSGLASATLPILNIDHHPDNQMFGEANLVDQEKSSVAELVFDFLKYLGVEINAEISKCLLTGIFTDTGSFMHANTTATALSAAGELMKYGARVDRIFSQTYSNKDLSSLKAWGKALENTRIDKNNHVAVCVLTEADLKEIGEDLSEDAFAGLVDTLNTIPDTRFAIFVRQEGDYIKGSIRSEEGKNIDVARIAKAIAGGGGHRLAAGFKIKGRIERQADGSWKIK